MPQKLPRMEDVLRAEIRELSSKIQTHESTARRATAAAEKAKARRAELERDLNAFACQPVKGN